MKVTHNSIEEFRAYLCEEERSKATIEKYLRDAERFIRFANGEAITKGLVVSYKQYLQDQKYAIRSINSMLASLNSFLQFLGISNCKVKQLKQQREVFCPEEKELTHGEYMRLLGAAKSKPQLSLIMQSICATGIRVSELKHFTVESIRGGAVTVSCKNKRRTVFIPSKLRKMLLGYAADRRINSGCIFVTRKGTPLDRSYIWAQMKKLCSIAGVNPRKVFPHNLRKLFARAFYRVDKDIAKLADILGHSNIETTRIYIMTSGLEHRKKIEQLNLLL